jgi:hypothetical protein
VQQAQQAPQRQYSPYPQQHGQPHGHAYGQKPYKKRRSFLSDLFDD